MVGRHGGDFSPRLKRYHIDHTQSYSGDRPACHRRDIRILMLSTLQQDETLVLGKLLVNTGIFCLVDYAPDYWPVDRATAL